jgi:hypothetical protein
MKFFTIIASILISTALFAGCGNGAFDPDDIPQPPDNSSASQPHDEPIAEPGNASNGNGSITDDNNTPAPNHDNPQADDNDEFFFIFNGVEIRMGQPALPIIDKLGPPHEYFEAPSCAFDGVDKSWYYSGFVIHAFPLNDEDFILSVILNDDSNRTEKRVFIGMDYDDMVAAYGSDYERNQDQFLYRHGDTSLSFIIPDDFIASISYRYENAPEQ